MDRVRAEEIIQSKGVISVTYKNNPVWLESISTDDTINALVKDLHTNENLVVEIKDLEE